MTVKLLGLVVASGLSLAVSAAPAETMTRKLRGYGETTASFDGDKVTIRAASPEKAGLWAARYLHVNEKRVVKPGVVKLPDGTCNRIPSVESPNRRPPTLTARRFLLDGELSSLEFSREVLPSNSALRFGIILVINSLVIERCFPHEPDAS